MTAPGMRGSRAQSPAEFTFVGLPKNSYVDVRVSVAKEVFARRPGLTRDEPVIYGAEP